MSSRKSCFTPVSSKEILEKIDNTCLKLIKLVVENKFLCIFHPRYPKYSKLVDDSGKNVLSYSQVKFSTSRANSMQKFATMLKILKIIYSLIQENRYCTKRDIFYQYPDLYPSQSFIDQIIDGTASMLQVPRWELHILAASKGLVAGDLQFEDSNGKYFDCQLSVCGVNIGSHYKDMQNIQTGAEFVLVVEKEATFQQLLSYQFCQKMKKCILVTGKGFPDYATRMLLKEIVASYHLPIFLLVDADPHGIEIMAVYKFGSKLSDSKSLAIPSAEWIGLLPEDISRYHIPDSALSSLNEKQLQLCVNLKKRPYFLKDVYILSQIDILIELGKKAEIQSLDSISTNFLCDVYLPNRFQVLMT